MSLMELDKVLNVGDNKTAILEKAMKICNFVLLVVRDGHLMNILTYYSNSMLPNYSTI